MKKVKSFSHSLGTRGVLWINPKRIDLHTGTKWPVAKARIKKLQKVLPKPVVDLLRPALKSREPFLVPRDAFARGVPVERTERWKRVVNFIEKRADLRSTEWFQTLAQELSRTGVSHHKKIAMRSEAEILEFLETYVCGLIDSLSTEGFLPQHTGYESSAVVGADGRLTKAGSGNHRFNICRALGVTPFPVRIVGVHEDWFSGNANGAPISIELISEMLKSVEAAHQ